MHWVARLAFCAVIWAGVGTAMADPASEGWAAVGRGDYDTGLKLLRPIAEAGDATAQVSMGYLYARGLGVAQDPQIAFEWYNKAAIQGHPLGQHEVGRAYTEGVGVAKDTEAGLTWLRKSADQGFDKSQFVIGRAYLRGEGSPKDLPEAARWMQKAADQDYYAAEMTLGIMYRRGDGVERNLLSSRYWLQRSVQHGGSNATKSLDELNAMILEAESRGVPETSGGDGSSQDRAILLPKTTNEIEGVRGERSVVATYFPGWQWGIQALIHTPDGRVYDSVELTRGSESKTIYFDIANWFGKLE